MHIASRWMVLAGLLVLGQPASADPLQLADLMHLLAQGRPTRASYVERKYLAVLDHPVESSGELSFTPPDTVEKRTLKPRPALILLKGDTITLERADHRSLKVSLREHPEVAAFVDSIRGTLNGDRVALEASYHLELSGQLDDWTLALTPNDTAMRKVVTRIRIGGTQADITTIEFEQADGDRSVMQISRRQDP
jgi:hypothetical protein